VVSSTPRPQFTPGKDPVPIAQKAGWAPGQRQDGRKISSPPGFFFGPMPPHVLVDFVILPPGHGRSVTDFSGWEAHEAQLRCPDDVSGDRRRCSARRALKPKFY